MNIPIWFAGVVSTLLLAFVSLLARKWWPLAWLLCIFVAGGAGLILHFDHPHVAGLWWAGWMGYAPTLPIMRLVLSWREQHRAESDRRKLFNALMVDLDRGDRATRDSW